MSDDFVMPPCDVCGEPAIHLARDVTRHEPPGAPYAEFRPRGVLKAGCDKHPVHSIEYITELPPYD